MKVHEAWSNVMAEVQGISKKERNTSQNFNFRGIDTVLNAVGPAARQEQVSIVPIMVGVVADERYKTAKGTEMRNVTLNITFRVYGPEGDSFDGQACGEAADSGDKAVSKAHSVAYRTFLLQALCIPTDEPDPDFESHERKANDEAAVLAKEVFGGNGKAKVEVLDPDAVMTAEKRVEVEEYAKAAGFDFWDTAAEVIGGDGEDEITNAQARAVCQEISNRKKTKEKVEDIEALENASRPEPAKT